MFDAVLNALILNAYLVLEDKPEKVWEVELAALLATTWDQAVEASQLPTFRSILKPSSFVELSFQLMVTWVEDLAMAARLDGELGDAGKGVNPETKSSA